MRSVLLATCAAYPNGDDDAEPLVAALRACEVNATWVIWDDPLVDWSAGPTVLRSTWDYTLQHAQFLEWVRSLPRVLNAAEVVLWNADKIYLRDLEAAGVPITPTGFAPVGTPPSLPDDVEFVVKPSVGAGSRGAGRFAPSAARSAVQHAAMLHAAGRTVLVQPYLSAVDTNGETALIYLGGEFSHAIRKGPMLSGSVSYDLDQTTGLFIDENISARVPSEAELAVGAQALAAVQSRFAELLYARVDLLPGPSGPVVIELELTEPSLYLSYGSGAVERFAAAIAARI